MVGAFEDEVRAEQALRALDVWRRANGGLGLGAVGVVARRASGTTTARTWGVLRPGRSALVGLVVGVVLLALPAAGAAWLAAWVLATLVFGLAGLIGAIPADQTGTMAFAAAAGFALLVALFVGAVGAAIGCLIGVVVGLIDSRARGLSGTEVTRTCAALAPGAWATVARARPDAAGLVQAELTRLGGVPALVDGMATPPVIVER